jgi:hypothetical protein
MVFWRYLWRFEGVVCWEMDGKEEDSTGVRAIALKMKISKSLQAKTSLKDIKEGLPVP